MARFTRLGFLLGALLVAATTWAAITGSISGVVTDPSGAVIPGLTLVATSLSTNVKTTAIPASLFIVPADYKKLANPLEKMMGQ